MSRIVSEIVLAHAITAPAVEGDFATIERTLPDRPPAGMLHIRPLWLALDPYVGQRLRGRHIGDAAPAPGEPLPGESVSIVLSSDHPDFAPGDHVVGHAGWTEEAIVPASAMRRVDRHAGIAEHLGVLGMPGLAAWAGVTQLATVGEGDLFCVDAAAGSVGGTAGQLARIAGARVVGIAGGAQKVAVARGAYRFDDCIDYHLDGWQDALGAAAPGGITVHFENVGSKVLDVAIPRMRVNCQIVLCGLAQHYADGSPALLNAGMLMGKRATVRGLIVYDYFPRQADWVAFAAPLIASGELVEFQDVAEGLASAPEQLVRVVRGATVGRPLVRIATA